MLVDRVIKYYDKEYDLNCAECMLVAANEEYDLNISKQTLMAMASFGGGMTIGSICGAITGAIATLGIMFTTERGHQSPQVKVMTSKFMNEYYKRMGTLECLPLKERYYEKDLPRCTKMMITAAEVLDEIVKEYSQYYVINR